MSQDQQATLDGAQAGQDGPPEGDNGKLTTYVVQVAVPDLFIEADDPFEGWRDVATIKVPARTHRQTALEAGLAEAGIEVTLELRARLLDADAFYVWTGAPPKTLRLI